MKFDHPSGVTCASSPTVEPVRQGEIASLSAELDACIRENAAQITRLYELARRLGVSPAPLDAAPSPFPPQPGQLGELRDGVGRLRRENASFSLALEALENL